MRDEKAKGKRQKAKGNGDGDEKENLFRSPFSVFRS
jgi:hypothetical protein